MYGCPEEVPNVWDSTLGVLALKGDPANFRHPVIDKLIQVKWDMFGSITCLVLQFIYLAHVALFFTGFVGRGNDCGDDSRIIRYVTAGVSVTMIVTAVGLMVSQERYGLVSRQELTIGERIPYLRRPIVISIPRFLQNQWNTIRCISNVLILITAFGPSSKCDGHSGLVEGGSVMEDGMRTLSAVTAVLMGLQVLEILILSKKLSAFAFTMMRLIWQLLINIVICLVAIFAFSGGLVIIRDDYFDSLEEAMQNLIKITLGIASPDMVQDANTETVTLVLLFLVVVWIGFLNVLIAQFVYGYNTISNETDAYALMMRAQTICEMESFLPRWLRLRYFNEMQFDLPLNYDAGDEGPGGGIQVLESATVKQSAHYVPDRVLRFTGEASANDPWPSLEEAGVVVEGEDEAASQR